MLPETDMRYFGDDGDRMHMMFNFQVNQHLFYSLAAGDARPLARSLIRMRKEVPEIGWGNFSVVETNHRAVIALRSSGATTRWW